MAAALYNDYDVTLTRGSFSNNTADVRRRDV